MEHKYIAQLRTNEELVDFYMVKSIAVKVGSNRKQYLDVLLADKTGEISGKKWELVDEELEKLSTIEVGNIAKIAASVTEWNGMKQFRITKIRRGQKEDGTDLSNYIRTAPEPAEDMYEYLLQKAQEISDSDLRTLCVQRFEENREKLLYYPAASKNHGAEMAGLLWHEKRMAMLGERACEVYTMLDRDLLMAGVLLHDLEKIREIQSNEYGISDGYTFEGQMLGHITMGVRELAVEMTKLGFPEEKKVMVEHMVLSHHYEPDYGSPKRPLFPEAEMLHYLDIIDARLYDFEEALSKTEPGEFSDRVWTLENRRLYRRKDTDKQNG
ncbi:MAG: HD domain-containing protein [Eubacteriaceae bacterium]|jgi:3'-5' exoribonuclease|nr:HD domain-containing protein [Eubacteriaceae bacterium]